MRYCLVSVINGRPDEPQKHYYEVDSDENVLRAVEDFGDSGYAWDAVSEYKGSQSSLLEMPYSDIEWDEEPANLPEDEQLMIESAVDADTFEAVFKDAQEKGERVEW